MVKLLLWRHAHSGIHSPTLADIDRPLSSRGRRHRQKTAALIKNDFAPDFILCSPSVRTRQTLEALDADDIPVRFSDALYHGHIHDILTLAQDVDNSHASVLMIGHNPGFEDMVVGVLENSRTDNASYNIFMDGLARGFRTSSLAAIQWDITDWQMIDLPQARLQALYVRGMTQPLTGNT